MADATQRLERALRELGALSPADDYIPRMPGALWTYDELTPFPRLAGAQPRVITVPQHASVALEARGDEYRLVGFALGAPFSLAPPARDPVDEATARLDPPLDGVAQLYEQ